MKPCLPLAFIGLLGACYTSYDRASDKSTTESRQETRPDNNRRDAANASDTIGEMVDDGFEVDGPAYSAADLETFDPGEVYIYGTLHEAWAGHDAVAHWSTPNLAIVGFDNHVEAESAQIRPGDGKLLYWAIFENVLRVFHCDGCQYVSPEDHYPENPESNDEIVPTPPCYTDNNPMRRAIVGPDGAIVYRCIDDSWYNSNGDIVIQGSAYSSIDGSIVDLADMVLHLGHQSALLLSRGIYRDGVLKEFVGLPEDGAIRAFRALDDGFWVVIYIQSEHRNPELWHVDYEGLADYVGTYAMLPDNVGVTDIYGKLDSRGRLYRICNALPDFTDFLQDPTDPTNLPETDFNDFIIRRTIDGETETVYDEVDEPYVKLHTSALFTGP